MIHPDTELRYVSPAVGYGVFATRPIPRGTLTWVLDPLDQRIPPDRVGELDPEYQSLLIRYAYLDQGGHTVLSWDHGRFVNHSCQSSCASGGCDEFEIALRDIEVGEQITDDYAELETDETFPCACGSPLCRGQVGPEGREAVRARLALAVQDALACGSQVPQPLLRSALNPRELERALKLPKPYSVAG